MVKLVLVISNISLMHVINSTILHRSKFTNSTGHMIQAQMAEQLYKSVLERLKVR